ncbi:hypothetical protein BC826DRAFT_500361 [Russula brevipes]|nr:hypothetical protein BC826DRAFT_500361 [Russula brevipes]
MWSPHAPSRMKRLPQVLPLGLIDLAVFICRASLGPDPPYQYIMSAPPPVPPNISRVTAPLLLAGLWNWGLYGVLVVQFYVYSYNFPDDKRSLKLLVYAIFVIETIQTGLNCADLFYWLISGYGDVTHLSSFFASSIDVPIIESVVSIIVQFFYAYRIWILSAKQSWWFCLLICLSSTVGAAAGFTGGIYTTIRKRWASGGRLKAMALTWVIGNATGDILIAAAMLYYLAKRRRAADSAFNDHALVKIVRLTIETNVLTTSVGIVSLLMIVIYPNENWYTCPTSILGKLYSNTFLVWLNNRISIRNAATARAVANRPQALTLGSAPHSDFGADVTFMEMEQSSASIKLPSSASV